MFDPSILRPGDHLLYRPGGFWGWLIAIKTVRLVSHVEVYEGDGYSVASREGSGVNRYALRTKGLAYVLRPSGPIDLAAATAWFERNARGQRYDWKALFRYLWPRTTDTDTDRMICSAMVTRYDRAGRFHPVSPDADADLISPGSFLDSPAFTKVWTDGR